MFRHKVLKAPGDCLYLKKYLLRTFHSCSSLCFVPLPPLQCYLGQNLKMKERKWSVWEASCVTSGFGSCWGRPVRTLWGRRDQVRGRTTPPLSEGFVMPGQLSRECLSVCPSLWGWQEADSFPQLFPLSHCKWDSEKQPLAPRQLLSCWLVLPIN